MSVELVKNPLKVCRIIGEEISGTVVEEDINVPDVNPDVYKILHPSARVVIKGSETTNDKIIVDGQVLIDILYVADAEGRPLNSLNISADFTHAIDMVGVKPRMKEQIKAVIQHIDCQIINSRKISVKVIMDIACIVEDIYEIEIPLDIRGSDYIQVLREPLNIKGITGINNDKYNIKKEIQPQVVGAPIKEILKSNLSSYIKDCQSLEGKMQVDGQVFYNILYKTEDNEINNIRGEIPFTEYLEIAEADLSMDAVAHAKVRDSYIEISSDEEGEKKNITISTFLDIDGRTFSRGGSEVLADAYNPKFTINMEKKNYELDEFLCQGSNSTTIKDSFKIKQGSPDIKKVCFLDAKPLVHDIKVMDGKIGIEGIVEVCVLYKSSFTGEPMNCATNQFPFKMFIDLPEVKTTMTPKVICQIDNVTYSTVNENLIDIRINILAIGTVYKKIIKRIITKIEEKEETKTDYNALPAITVYVVGPGDSLWKIAKRYNTTVDALAKLNNIDNPDVINVGDKLLILKNMRQ